MPPADINSVAEGLACGTKGNGVEPRAVAAFEHDAHVGFADEFAELDAMRRQHETRFGIALAERADALDHIHQLAASRRRRREPRRCRGLPRLGRSSLPRQDAKEILLECSEALPADRQSRRHRVTAAL